MMEQKIVMLTAKVPQALAIEARVEAAKLNLSRSALVREALKIHLANLQRRGVRADVKQ